MNDDTRRALEQEALRNVRSYLDTHEEVERTRYWNSVKIVVLALGTVACALAAKYWYDVLTSPSRAVTGRAAAASYSQPSLMPPHRPPRIVVVDSRVDASMRAYVADCVGTILALGNSTYRSEIGPIEGTARIEFDVRYDGMVGDVTALEWSGHPATESTARRMVKQARCEFLPAGVRREADVLRATHTFAFRSGSMS